MPGCYLHTSISSLNCWISFLLLSILIPFNPPVLSNFSFRNIVNGLNKTPRFLVVPLIKLALCSIKILRKISWETMIYTVDQFTWHRKFSWSQQPDEATFEELYEPQDLSWKDSPFSRLAKPQHKSQVWGALSCGCSITDMRARLTSGGCTF